ncbi:MAG: hypothetical protein K0R59_119 [Sphingobacterium sp.]|nr:hypothetical protein [Sphingobacterium sp.]
MEDDSLGTKKVMWPQNHVIKIAFMNGTKERHDFVKEYTKVWDELINLSFSFQDSLPGSEIRIKFDPNSGSGSSYVGWNNNINRPDTLHTMILFGKLGANGLKKSPTEFELGTLRHEFGHMLGLVHEQYRPDSDILWVDPMRPGGNVLDSIKFENYLKSPYDRNSIMHYAVYRSATKDSLSIPLYVLKGELSQIDKDYISKVYPN